jgi:hypothetical protein
VGDDATDRLLDPSYLDGMRDLPIEEIRSRRAECQAVETGLSYLRRVVQGRLDITAAELHRRRDGGDPADMSTLIDQLPEILADHLRAPGLGRLPTGTDPGRVDPELEARVDDTVAPLDDLASLTDDDLAAVSARLTELEQEISERRRALFDRIDALQAELTRRYKAGEASVESLLH